jgi:Flp pilus assembly protein TadD
LHETGKAAQAIDVLKSALARHPYDRDVLTALASYEIEAGDLDSAVSRAELLSELEPDSREIQQFLTTVRNLAK